MLGVAGSPAYADDDFIKGLIGGMVGAAIANGAKATPPKGNRNSSNSVSSAQRTENKKIQTALNYYGFNAGTPDGILGGKTRKAVSQYQACLNYTITGKLNSFEKQFLTDSYFKSLAAGNETLRLVASKQNGYCGLLQQYLAQLIAPADAEQGNSMAPAPVPKVTQSAEVNNVTVINTKNSNYNSINVSVSINEFQADYDRLIIQVKLLQQIIQHLDSKSTNSSSTKKLKAVRDRVHNLEVLVNKYEREGRSKYGVPIRPSNANIGVTAVKASEAFPRVPYYIPGTEELGELWIKPYVSDVGELMYDFNFVDDNSEFSNIKETISLSADEIPLISSALLKINKWSDQALEKNLRRRFEKSAACFPQDMCGKSEVGKSSTDIMFMLYEDGATAVKIQQNKGRFKSSYNVSIESGLLLAAYTDYMIELGSKEFEAATMTDAELDAVFD